MVELLEANLQVSGREGVRCYWASLRWSSGVSKQYVIFETEFPKLAKRIQELMDVTKEMNVSERLRHIQEKLAEWHTFA